MPRYHFNVSDGQAISDRRGTEFADLKSAQRCAVRYAGQLLSEIGEEFWAGEDWVMTVTDARGLTLFTLSFVATLAPAYSL